MDNTIFSSASQHRVKLQREIAPGEFIQIDGDIKYVGSHIDGLVDFNNYIQDCINNYRYGAKLVQQEEIIITEEDHIKLTNLGKFLRDNFFHLDFSTMDMSENIKTFKNARSAKGFEYAEYASNCLMYSLLYFFDEHQTPVTVRKKFTTYSNLGFTFRPSPKKGGVDVNFSFGQSIGYGASHTVCGEAFDTIEKMLTNGFSSVNAKYRFKIFKLGEDTYRVEVTFSTARSSGFGRSDYDNQKIGHFVVEIK